MGCNVVKASKLNKTASYKNEKIIKPSNFVKINPKHFRDVYILGKILGQGAYGTVYFCTHIISGIQRAVKIYDKADLNLANQALLLQEIDILKPLDHPNIISVYEFFEDDLEFSIVLEHCGGGELFQEIVNHRAFTEYEIALIMKQLLSAVYYLHSHNIVHRDIKPENIVFDDSSENLSVKLIDFGSATKINSNEKLKISVGTVYYAAPEIFDQDYDEKCDV